MSSNATPQHTTAELYRTILALEEDVRRLNDTIDNQNQHIRHLTDSSEEIHHEEYEVRDNVVFLTRQPKE